MHYAQLINSSFTTGPNILRNQSVDILGDKGMEIEIPINRKVNRFRFSHEILIASSYILTIRSLILFENHVLFIDIPYASHKVIKSRVTTFFMGLT
jgi:hypothetical protein